MQQLIFTDPLTGLNNRRQFLKTLVSMTENRKKGEDLYFAMVDIDHFKSINDGSGHETGDRALVILSTALAKCFEKKQQACKKENLIDHLSQTGDLASFFASSFGGDQIAEQAGLLHDLGKHTEKFQGVLEGTVHSIDHSAVGAEYYWNHVSDEYIEDSSVP